MQGTTQRIKTRRRGCERISALGWLFSGVVGALAALAVAEALRVFVVPLLRMCH